MQKSSNVTKRDRSGRENSRSRGKGLKKTLRPLKSLRKVRKRSKKTKPNVEEFFLSNYDALSVSDTLTLSSEKLEHVLRSNSVDLGVMQHNRSHEMSDATTSGDTFSMTSLSRKYQVCQYGRGRELSSDDVSSLSLDSHNFDYQSIHSTESHKSNKISTRRLLLEISDRVKNDQAPPDFVPSLSDINPSLISWNRKLPKGKYNKGNPPLNIIPCLQPLEVILAKADLRLRQQKKVGELKEMNDDARIKRIDDLITAKFTRAERAAALMELHQRQILMFRMYTVCYYVKSLMDKYFVKEYSESRFKNIVREAIKIQKFFKKWFRIYKLKKLQERYITSFSTIEAMLRIKIRMKQKRNAAARIKQFLLDFRGYHKVFHIYSSIEHDSLYH